MNMYHWKWSLGEPYYKSARLEKEVSNSSETVSEYDTQQSAINQSLEEDLSSNSNNSKSLNLRPSNSKQNSCNKLAKRFLRTIGLR